MRQLGLLSILFLSLGGAVGAGSETGASNLDPGWRAPEVIEFIGLKEVDRVADIVAGRLTAALARAVGSSGTVYAIETAEIVRVHPDALTQMKALAAASPNIIVSAEPVAAPLPSALDAVLIRQNYHDLYDPFMGPADVRAFNAAVFAALKPGGAYVVLDHAALQGSGVSVTDTLHRIDPARVKADVLAAGFVLDGESSILASSTDDHTRNVFDPSVRGHTDQFLLRFRKPAPGARVFDTHVHLWNGEKSVLEYLTQLEQTHQTMTRFAGILMAQRGHLPETRRKNDELLALTAKYPELFPIGSVHPYDGRAALDELGRIAGLGITMIKLHPHTQKFAINDPRVAALCRRAGQLGMMVLFDNANIVPGDSQDLFNLAIDTPATKFVFAHMGATNFRFWNTIVFARTAKDFYKDNIYFDISATVTLISGSPLEAEFVWTIRNVGIEHVFLGSDYPQFTLRQTVDALERLPLDRDEKDMIRFENARRLLTPRWPKS